MKVAVIGSGGREHAIIKSISLNPKVEVIYAISGNGGMTEAICENIDIRDIDSVVNFCKLKEIDFVIVAPDDPLAAGMVDALENVGIKTFGPTKKAAMIESSKAFSKNLMKKYNIPTAKYEVFEDMDKAFEYIENTSFPLVIKADGLALGKGVIIANTKDEGTLVIKEMMLEKKFGNSGLKIVIEEYLSGVEVSVLAFTDGKTIIPMISSMDHKKALDNDEGLNTGGMGTIAPNPYYTEEIADKCMQEIFIPTINAMNTEDRKFKGCLYFGLMLTKTGAKVIEYNCRFGDPETQVVLPLLDSDLLEIMLAVREERLDKIEVKWKNKCACCVVIASGGYPQSYKTGYEIKGISDCKEVFVAGAKLEDKKLVTSGGRVLGVVGIGDTLEKAIELAYKDAQKISFKDMYMRNDIGKKALEINK